MKIPKNTLLLVIILLASTAAVFILAWTNATWSVQYADLVTVLNTTTATFGTLLGIITAGLMFTHGKFSELDSELSEKTPNYLTETLSLEKVQQAESHLLNLRKTFQQLETETTVPEEKNLYNRITQNTSSLFINFAVLLNLKLQQQGLRLDTSFLVSEMDSQLYATYQKTRKNIKKEWQILSTFKQMTDIWEGPTSTIVEKPEKRTSLQTDLKNAITILELKEKINKNPQNHSSKIAKALNELNDEVNKIQKHLHQDRIPQLLSQMKQASALRGKYFYLTLIFIAAPLFVNLLVLPQLSESTAPFFKQIILATSSLSILGFVFLLVYIQKILSV